MSEVLLKNCEIVNAERTSAGSLLLGDGKIQAILPAGDQPQAETVIDVQGAPVIPGVIDTHTHLGSARPLVEDLATETRSAVATGITTVMNYIMEMESYKDIIPRHEEDVKAHSMVDVWFHTAIMTDVHLHELAEYVEDYDIASFKFFMAYKGADALPMVRGIDDGMLLDAFTVLSRYPHVLPMVHAENIELVLRSIDRVKETGREDLAAWSEARPMIAEEEAQRRAWFLARHAEARLLVVHMSAGYTVEQLASERETYPHFYGETCPHFLGLDTSMTLGGLGKCNPPVRDSANAAQLWDALDKGLIDFIGSDHAPWGREAKEGSLWEAAPGLPSMPAILPVLLSDGVNAGRLSLQQLVQLTSYNAAEIFGLPSKGRIAVGADADLTVLDLSWQRTFTPEAVCSGLDWSPFDGLAFKGWPSLTVAGGKVVAERGAIVDEGARGRRLRPTAASRAGVAV